LPGKALKISISTPERTLFSGETISLIAPGKSGYFGILVDHAPLIANLGPGKIIIKGDGARSTVFDNKGTGILEVLRNEVSMLVDDATEAK